MLRPADSGGETLLVDGFAVTEALKRSDPEAYRVLASQPVHWKYKPAALEHFHRSVAPVIQLEHDRLVAFRWSNKDRDVLRDVAPERVDEWYRAYKKLAALIDAPSSRLKLRLGPGSVLLLDNWRVAHGREPYVGERSLYGAYVLRDTMDSKRRYLEWHIGGSGTDTDRLGSTNTTTTTQTPPSEECASDAEVSVSYTRLDEGTFEESHLES